MVMTLYNIDQLDDLEAIADRCGIQLRITRLRPSGRVADDGVAQLGRLDVVAADAGLFTFGRQTQYVPEKAWQEMIEVSSAGVWHSGESAIPHLKTTGAGGSITIINSPAVFKDLPGVAVYTATKPGIVEPAKVLADELSPEQIRVNAIRPNTIATPMVQNKAVYRFFHPELEHPSLQAAEPAFASLDPMRSPLSSRSGPRMRCSSSLRTRPGTSLGHNHRWMPVRRLSSSSITTRREQ